MLALRICFVGNSSPILSTIRQVIVAEKFETRDFIFAVVLCVMSRDVCSIPMSATSVFVFCSPNRLCKFAVIICGWEHESNNARHSCCLPWLS